MASRTSDPDGDLRPVLTLLVLLAVLAVSRDMPTASASGLELLPMKLRWSIAWMGLQARSPLTPLAAQLAANMDPGQRTGLGQEAASYLARHGGVRDRLRWSTALARTDRRALRLVVRAVDAALATRDCSLLRAAVRAARTLPREDRATVAREFGRRRFAHWGPAAPQAGLQLSNQPELRHALLRSQGSPTIRGDAAPCAM